jgi:hypothetical protein
MRWPAHNMSAGTVMARANVGIHQGECRIGKKPANFGGSGL